MRACRFVCRRALALLAAAALLPASLAQAHHTGATHVHFQKPKVTDAGQRNRPANEGLHFRRAKLSNSPPGAETTRRAAPRPSPVAKAPASSRNEVQHERAAASAPTKKPPAKPKRRPAFVTAAAENAQAAKPAQSYRAKRPVRHDSPPGRRSAADGLVAYESDRRGNVQPAAYYDQCIGGCDCEPACGISEPGCGIVDPSCGLVEPGCGIVEPGCGMIGCGTVDATCGCPEPTCGCAQPGCGICDVGPDCGIADPSCGLADCGGGVGCGSCVGLGGPDYDCIPICIPRFKHLTFWGGVHGFKGPRDSPAFGGQGDGNFGFQEGINVSGRAPLVGLLFPQLSYQLGYQAVQSRLSGVSGGPTADGDRPQQFVTAGVFRRVPVGLQYGVVFDLLRDDLMMEEDFHQIRYEISMKSPKGREFGFWGATHTNNAFVGGINYQAVDQYAGFYRWHFRGGGSGRIWGGGTNDNEGLVGADFEVPLNDRWTVQTGFNYLITDRDSGPDGAREESWNVGMNLVWHYGRRARSSRRDPFRPLFRVADNGWMFVDQEP